MNTSWASVAITRVGLLSLWLGRVLGVLLALMYLAFLIGEGPPNLLRQTTTQNLQFAMFAVCAVGGLMGLRWPIAGALLNLGGLAVFYAIEHTVSGHWPRGAFPLFALPGACYLLASLLSAPGHGPRTVS